MLNARRQHGVVVLGDLIRWRRKARNRIMRFHGNRHYTIHTHTHTQIHTITPPSLPKTPTHPPQPDRLIDIFPLPPPFLLLLPVPPSILRLLSAARKKREEEIVTREGEKKKKTIKNIEWLETWKNVWLVISLRFVKYLPPRWRKKNGNGRHMEVSPSAVCTYA